MEEKELLTHLETQIIAATHMRWLPLMQPKGTERLSEYESLGSFFSHREHNSFYHLLLWQYVAFPVRPKERMLD